MSDAVRPAVSPAVGGTTTGTRATAERMGSAGSTTGDPATTRQPTTRPATTHPVTKGTAIPAATRTLALLPARPLTLSTRTPEGAVPPAASRTGGGRPVVPARWATAPATPDAAPAPPTRAPARPAPSSSTGAAATRHVQRAATTHRPHEPAVPRAASPAAQGTPPTGAVQRVPVVKPAPPRVAPGTVVTPAPARSLPVTGPRRAPLADGPSATEAPAPAPVGPVPVVRPRTVPPGPAAAGGGTGRGTTPVQRDVSPAGDLALPKGVPAKAAAAKSEPMRARSSSVSTAGDLAAPEGSGRRAAKPADSPQDPGADLDDLARRLLDPMARLLRTELRRGRERTGRPYDGRR
jgi:syndecan 1